MARYMPLLVGAFLTLAGNALAEHEESAAFLSLDHTGDTVAGWTMGINQKFNGCWVKSTFPDRTTVWMGFGGGTQAQPRIAFTNPKWQSVKAGEQYTLAIRSQSQSWNVPFVGVDVGSEKGMFSQPLYQNFVNDLAQTGTLVLYFGQNPVAQLNFSGSGNALSNAADCTKRYQEALVNGGAAPGEPPRKPPPKQGASFGTGFFVTMRGHAMTNYHVVDGCTKFAVLPAGVGTDPVPATLIAIDKHHDLAVLRTDYKPEEIAVLNPRMRLGESVYVFGYPMPEQLASSGNFTIGNITATAGEQGDPSMLQISAPIQSGNSGGALMDQYGNAVGVIVAKLNPIMGQGAKTIDVPQNVNFAIKASIALNFLEANGITSSPTPRSTPKDAATLAEDAKRFTVKVICQ